MKTILTGFAVASLLAGCATIDPLGSVVPDAETGEASLNTRAGVICREITGQLTGQLTNAYGAGFRCLAVGEEELTGCVTYSDGRFSYTSAGCKEPPVQVAPPVPDEKLKALLEDQGRALTEDHSNIMMLLDK